MMIPQAAAAGKPRVSEDRFGNKPDGAENAGGVAAAAVAALHLSRPAEGLSAQDFFLTCRLMYATVAAAIDVAAQSDSHPPSDSRSNQAAY